MNDFYEARNSIYCYKGTNVLINKLNIENEKELMKYEAKITAAKLLDLRQRGITGKFDIKHIIEIHKYLFEDLYSFAGKFRSENIAKGSFRFAGWEYIDIQLVNLLESLKKENYLQGLDREEFVKRLAYYMSELNVLHPFREGNGRTIREFIRQLSLKNNYIFNLKNERPQDVLDASIESVVDTTKLEKIINSCLEKIN